MFFTLFLRLFMDTTSTPQIIQNHNTTNVSNEVNRKEIQAAIAKALELRALHAAVMQGSSPANLRCPTVSPTSHPAFSAPDYPVFTPSYEDKPLPGHQQILMVNPNFAGSQEDYGLERSDDETSLPDYKKTKASSRKGLPSELANLEHHICPADDQICVTGSCTNLVTVLQASPGTDFCRSRRNSLVEFKSVSSFNRGKPSIIATVTEGGTKSVKKPNIVVPLTDSHSSLHPPSKHRGFNLTWLFPRLKKRHKDENSPTQTQSEKVSPIFEDLEIMSIETLKKELVAAKESRDASLIEVTEMKSSLGELKQKLEYLETYCEELNKALRVVVEGKNSQVPEKIGNLEKRWKSVNGNGENMMPVSEEVMVEGFLQVVSEARLSVRQFCKCLVGQIEETDNTLIDNLNLLLQPYKLSRNSMFSKAVLYHLEAIINQSFYQDFENCVFQKNGPPKLLDPRQDRQMHFSSFVALRNLSFNEVLRKGTKYYSDEFSKFCDQKMSCIIKTLNWTRPWPEQLLQAFFVAAKCIWLLHLLAFSFNPSLGILRIEENRSFDPHYMENISMDRQRSHGPSRVKIMVMPGFYMQERVLKCKVLCRYKSVA
ncbi:unnamed protein product [Ilex paraguariensis]|uniref:IRK-interacting protein n=1 Tax=Ilex paraguariensis TaxID=185542 RepID=A0ABC8SDW4_9AQUA